MLDSCPVPAVAKPMTAPEMAGLVGPAAAAVSGAELAIEAEPEAEGSTEQPGRYRKPDVVPTPALAPVPAPAPAPATASPAPEDAQGSDLDLATDVLAPCRQTPAHTPRKKPLGGGAQQTNPDPAAAAHAMASVASFTPATVSAAAVAGSTSPGIRACDPLTGAGSAPGAMSHDLRVTTSRIRPARDASSPTPDAARPGAEDPFCRKNSAGQAGLQVGGCLAVEFDEGIWDYGKITQVGVAPARRGHSLFEPLRAGHVSAEVAFLDGEVEWHDLFGNFDLGEGHMDVSDGWAPCRFVTQQEYSRRHRIPPALYRHEPPTAGATYLLADAAMVPGSPLSSRILV